MNKKLIIRLGLVILVLCIITLGYGGWCRKKSHHDIISGSSGSWTKQLGSTATDIARGVAIDTSNNIYAAGYTGGDLDGNTSSGNADLFITKYNSAGTKQWTEQLGSNLDDYAYGVATDTSDNVYGIVYTTGALTGTNQSGTDSFLVKYNTGGTWQWTQQIATDQYDNAYGVATDPGDNIYVAGSTKGVISSTSPTGLEDLFVVKYNSAGAQQWARQLGTVITDVAHSVVIDTSGPSTNVYVAGYTFGDMAGANQGETDIFLVKYNSDGMGQWTVQTGTASADYAYGVATDTNGDVYVVGGTSGALGGANQGFADLFVVKYNSAGVWQWSRQLGTSDMDVAYGVATDTSNNIYVTGYTEGDLDGQTNAGPSLTNDLFVVKYNSAGVKQWTRLLGTTSDDEANGVTVDTSGNIYVTGYTNGGLDGNTNTGASDFFVVKYNSAGEKQ